jgi:regulatory protein
MPYNGLLSYRPRSCEEVRRRLRKKDYTEDTIEEAIERLERAGLLDDRAFARYWIENRFRFNPRGKAFLRQELRQKGVRDRVIEEALDGYDEQTAAEEAAAAAVRRLRRLDEPTFRRKLIGYLRRRGFFYGTIRPIVEELVAERTSEEFWEENEE